MTTSKGDKCFFVSLIDVTNLFYRVIFVLMPRKLCVLNSMILQKYPVLIQYDVQISANNVLIGWSISGTHLTVVLTVMPIFQAEEAISLHA